MLDVEASEPRCSIECLKSKIWSLTTASSPPPTLKAISGLLKARGGEIHYQGRNIANLPPHQIVKLGISHVPEGRMIFANLTVQENLMMGAYLQRDKGVV